MKINFKSYGAGFPVIILHGLLGSLDNWQGVAKHLAGRFQVATIDLRNHGRSPHSGAFSYTLMVADILEWMQDQHIAQAHIIGHSMGGKVAMNVALSHPEKVSKPIVIDVAPVAYEDRHSSVFKALHAVDLGVLNSRQEAEQILRRYVEEESTVQFLMKGLYRDEEYRFQWRFNVEALYNAYPEISSGIVSKKPFAGQVLFIKGQNSDYINAANYAEIVDLFPNNQLVEIAGAGHWVHADNPKVLIAVIEEFLEK